MYKFKDQRFIQFIEIIISSFFKLENIVKYLVFLFFNNYIFFYRFFKI